MLREMVMKFSSLLLYCLFPYLQEGGPELLLEIHDTERDFVYFFCAV